MKDLRASIAETRARLAHAKAAGGPAKTFTIHNGEALANADTPSQSFYELTANANLPVLTAIRVEVPPLNADTARHTPENGFIVDKIEGWVISPAGEKTKIVFRAFVQDSETNLQSALFDGSDAKQKARQADPDDSVSSAFAALPKLFRTRWIVGVPSEPVQLTAREPHPG